MKTMTRIMTATTLLMFSGILMAQTPFVSDVSKKGTTAAPFLSIGQGARGAGMGAAYVAVADDPSALYYNPGGIAGLSGIRVIFDHTEWIVDTKYNFMALTYGINQDNTFGFSLTTSDLGDMRVTTIEEPNGTGEIFSVRDVAFSVAYAMRLTNNFSIGLSPKIVSQSIWNTNATAFAIDMGVQYETPFRGFTLGMSISNFGPKMKLDGNTNLVLYDSDPDNSGNNEKIPAYLGTEEWALPLNFRLGLAYTPQISDIHKVVLSVDAAHPNDNYESVNLGGEYVYNNFLAVRGGYKALFLKESEESLALGIGVRQQLLGNITIYVDYAYQDFGRLSDVQKFTIGMNF